MKKDEEPEAEENLRNSTKDGVAASAMVGLGENYASAVSVKLGADEAFIGSLTAIPQFCSALAQLSSVRAMKIFGRKRLVVSLAVAQALCWILMAGIVLALDAGSLEWILGIFTAYMVFGALISGPWTSWIGDVVPEGRRNSYFSERNRWLAVASIAAIISGGLILQLNPLGQLFSFSLVFLLAGAVRMVSAHYLAKIDAEEEGGVEAQEIMPWEIFRSQDEAKKNFVLFSFAFFFVLFIAAPFFVMHMFNNLKFSYLEFMIIILTSTIARVASLGYWGKRMDEYGIKAVLFASAIFIGLNPIFWSFISSFPLLILVEVTNGFAWSGFELASFNYLLGASDRKSRPGLMANYNFFISIARILGAALGVALVVFYGDRALLWGTGITAVFIISGVLRLASIGLAFDGVKEAEGKGGAKWRVVLKTATLYPATQSFAFVSEKIRSGREKLGGKIGRGRRKAGEIRRKIEWRIRVAAKRAKERSAEARRSIIRGAERAAEYGRSGPANARKGRAGK